MTRILTPQEIADKHYGYMSRTVQTLELDPEAIELLEKFPKGSSVELAYKIYSLYSKQKEKS